MNKQASVGSHTTLGIRPQHLRLNPKGQLSGHITLIERLGTETVVELRSPFDVLFHLATLETPELETNTNVTFSFKASGAHIF